MGTLRLDFFAFVLWVGSGAGVAPGSAVTFCCAKKPPKIAFEYPRRNSLRAARFVQTAAVSQSFYGGRHFALLVPFCFVFVAFLVLLPATFLALFVALLGGFLEFVYVSQGWEYS